MSGNSIVFGEEIKKLCQNMCSVPMLIWSAAYLDHWVGFGSEWCSANVGVNNLVKEVSAIEVLNLRIPVCK